MVVVLRDRAVPERVRQEQAMSSGRLLGWLKQGITKLVDSDRDERTDQLAKLLRKEIAGDRGKFVLASAVSKLEIQDGDLGLVIEKVYATTCPRLGRTMRFPSENAKVSNGSQTDCRFHLRSSRSSISRKG
jgi:hypothetical protein